MALSDDARLSVGDALGDMAPGTDEWRDHCTDHLSQAVMDAVLPDGRTIAQALDDGEKWRRWGKDLLGAILSGDMEAGWAAVAEWGGDA